MQRNNPTPNDPKGNEPTPDEPTGNEPKNNEKVAASGEVMDVWAFHDAFGVAHGPLRPPFEVWPDLDKAFRTMVDKAKAVDTARFQAVSISCTYLRDLLADHD
jgi:hypothetical protein